MIPDGARTWVFADGFLPEKSVSAGALEAHEALMLLNTGSLTARVSLDLFFGDRPPVKNIMVEVPAERVISLRMDIPAQVGGVVIPPLTQYAIRVRASHNVVVQFGRLDTTQPNLSYYVNVGYAASAPVQPYGNP